MSNNPRTSLIGRLAVHTKMISMDQLAEATRVQARKGGETNLGQVLVEKEMINPEQLQKLLRLQQQVMIKQRAERAAAQDPPEVGVTPAPSAPVPPQEAPAAAVSAPVPATVGASSAPRPADPALKEKLDEILKHAVLKQASDVHIHSGAPLRLRIHGCFIEAGSQVFEGPQVEGMLAQVLNADQWTQYQQSGEIDFAYEISGLARFRGNIYRQQRGADGVFRRIAEKPPTLEDLGLPTDLARFTNYHKGLVLVTGPASCGKSSTLAALVNIINEERREHILTIEDPIETVHPSKRCLVNQRQVGSHTESFARALRGALREDPDVIAIGELRDLETISLALTAAETGHFVLATLHTNSTIRTLNRLIGVFPPNQQGQIRTMVSESLKGIISQRLVPTADGTRRVPALEILVINRAVGNLIRDNKTFQIQSILQTGSSQGMCMLDNSLAELVQAGTITKMEALRHCEDPRRFGGDPREIDAEE